MDTPVLLLNFNRPTKTKKLLSVIEKVKPVKLYIVCDGPRENNEDDKLKVSEVRKILKNIPWATNVEYLFHERNLGCQDGPISGITWFFENEDSGIILEDDCIPNISFFSFCSQLLKKYWDNERIMAITGTNISKGINFETDYIFSNFALPWGWATWKRAWNKYDQYIEAWKSLRSTNWIEKSGVGSKIFVLHARHFLDETLHNTEKVTWWDYQWIFACWLHKGLTITPTRNLITNVGFGSDGNHTKKRDAMRDTLDNTIEIKINSHPCDIVVNKRYDLFIERHWFHATYKSIIKLKLKKILQLN